MLAVKWVDKYGNEMICGAVQVVASADERQSPSRVSSVTWHRSDGVECSADTGTVYIMNDDGKTIDRYVLDLNRQKSSLTSESSEG